MNVGTLPGLGRDPVLSPEPASGFTIQAQSTLPIPDHFSLVTVAGSGSIKRLSLRKKTQGPVWLYFTGSARLVHDATFLYVPGAADQIMSDGCLAFCVPLGNGKWRIADIRRPAGVRERLAADRTYYVATTGSDTLNDGRSATSPFLTIQKAINVVAALDISTYNVTIQVGDGTYTAAGVTVTGPWLGSGTVTLLGNTTTPANCIISVTGGNCIYLTSGARLSAGGFKLTTTTSGRGVLVNNFSAFSAAAKMECGACADDHVLAQNISTFNGNGYDYTVSGGASRHWYAINGSIITVQSRTITISGSPAFTQWAYATLAGQIICNANIFSGSATGQRYVASAGGIIETYGSGATYLPGNSGGSGTNFSASPYGIYE